MVRFFQFPVVLGSTVWRPAGFAYLGYFSLTHLHWMTFVKNLMRLYWRWGAQAPEKGLLTCPVCRAANPWPQPQLVPAGQVGKWRQSFTSHPIASQISKVCTSSRRFTILCICDDNYEEQKKSSFTRCEIDNGVICLLLWFSLRVKSFRKIDFRLKPLCDDVRVGVDC